MLFKKSFFALLIYFLPVLLLSLPAAADDTDFLFYTYGDISKSETIIYTTHLSSENILVLPANVSADEVVLFSDTELELTVSGVLGKADFTSGQPLEISDICTDDNYSLTFYEKNCEDQAVYKLRLCFAKNIPSVYLVSEDAAAQGRSWVEASYTKVNKAKGTIVLQNASGEIEHIASLTQIKGRGNTTWGLPKRPYQIKLDKKTDLLNTGNEKNKSKTWILLANYLDPVGVRNTLALNIGSALGMPSNIQGKSVNLYYDGEYRGLYMLTEKVEIGSGRVEIEDLEDANEKANPDTDIKSLPLSLATTENGATYTYFEEMNSPEDISGGYLLEMDYEVRALEEKCFIKTTRNNYVVVKSPEYASKDEMNYIATLYQDYEDAVFEGGTNSRTGKKYSDYVDARSVVCYYLVNELSKSRDCFSSSAYLHKKAGEDKLYMGPLWDYDMSFGKGAYGNYFDDDTPYGVTASGIEFCETLLGISEFYELAKDIYLNELLPLVNNVILGDEEAVSDNGALKSLEFYLNEIKDSAEYNSCLWYPDVKLQKDIESLYSFISERKEILAEYFSQYENILDIPENRYYDVQEYKWYFESITDVTEKGILNGVGKRMFNPESNVTRAQAAQALYNLSGRKPVEFEEIYIDVPSEKWYADAIVWANKNGLTSVFDDITFEPERDITREEFVGMLYRYSGAPDTDSDIISDFEDKELVNDKNAFEWALSQGIIVGDGSYIHPLKNMTRAEFAAILSRYCK